MTGLHAAPISALNHVQLLTSQQMFAEFGIWMDALQALCSIAHCC